MKAPEPTVFVVDDDPAMRDSLKELVESRGMTAETFSSAEAFLDGYDPQRAGCLLLDLRMPGMDGLSLQKRLSAQTPPLPIIMITGHGEVPHASQSLRMGAVDFLRKPFDADVLLHRIEEAVRRDALGRQAAAAEAEIKSQLALLSSREREVMEMLVSGESNKAIAFRLGIAVRTVEDHRARIMDKMQAVSLAALVRLATRLESYKHLPEVPSAKLETLRAWKPTI